MIEALCRLTAWLSPAYPVGAYSYSHGIEWAVGCGAVSDPVSARAWIADCLVHGAGRTDAILLAEAWRAAGDPAALEEIAELAAALAISAERLTETAAQGAAFAATTAAAWDDPSATSAPYPVALGSAAGRAGIPLEPALRLFLQAWTSNLISAAVRLVPLGQTDGQRILAALMPDCRAMAAEAGSSSLDDIGGCAVFSDIASMRHETQATRLFRT